MVWLIADHIGSAEPLRFDPVNAWAATLLLAIAFDLARPHAVSPGRRSTVERYHRVATLTLSLAGTGTNASSDAALRTLRQTLIPSTLGSVPRVRAYVAGQTAASYDFNQTMKRRLPLVMGFVLGLAFVLLLVTFRSLVIPLKTIVPQLLSVAAAYGLVTLVFPEGYLGSVLGAQDGGGVILPPS